MQSYSYVVLQLCLQLCNSVEPLTKENDISFIINHRQSARKNPAPLRETKSSHTPPAIAMWKINSSKASIILSIWWHPDHLKQLYYFKTFKHVVYVLRQLVVRSHFCVCVDSGWSLYLKGVCIVFRLSFSCLAMWK